MAHGPRQGRQNGLRVAIVPIAAQQHMDCMGVPHVMDARRGSGGREDGAVPAQLAEALAESGSGVGPLRLRAVGEQGGTCGVRETLPLPEVGVQFPPGVAGARDLRKFERRTSSVCREGSLSPTQSRTSSPRRRPAVYRRTTARRLTAARSGESAADLSCPACCNRVRICCWLRIQGRGAGAGAGNWAGSGTKQSGAVRRRYRVNLRTICILLRRPWGLSCSSVRAQAAKLLAVRSLWPCWASEPSSAWRIRASLSYLKPSERCRSM